MMIFFIILFFTACGHSQNPLDATTANEAAPLPVISRNVSTDNQNSYVNVQDDRNNLANQMAAHPPQPLPAFIPPPVLAESEPETPLDPFIQQIVTFTPGDGAGFGASDLVFWLLGPPFGGGSFAQSTDVVSLGNGGEILLAFPIFFPIDRPGPDFIIFENPFRPRGANNTFVEPARVSVSRDGIHFLDFWCEQQFPYTGCAGTHPVHANAERNNINPRDPATAGGDAFDLALLGVDYARFIKIADINTRLGGDAAVQVGQAGFDLDAISVVHGAKP